MSLENGACNGNNEVNFELTGFRVSGFVKSHSKCTSGAVPHGGEKVELLGHDDVVVAAMNTKKEDGSFSFENVAPGAYTLRSAGSTVAIQVVASNLEVKTDMAVAGYTVEGSVVESGKKPSPIPGFDVVLYSRTGDSIPCPVSDLTAYPKNSQYGSPVCVVKTDDKGRFTFPSVPCGAFVVAPFVSSSNTFQFDTDHRELSIDHSSKPFSVAPFTLTGMTVSGNVFSAKSKPISDAQVTLTSSSSSSFTATTTIDGKYTIEKVPIGKYSVKTEKKGHHFPTLNVDVSARHSTAVPDAVVSQVDICGKISIPHPPAGVSGSAKRKVKLSTPEGTFDSQTVSDQHGAFCFQVPAQSSAHTVSIFPIITSFEKEAGLLLSSFETTLAIDTVPIFNVHFVQALLTIRGRVKCISEPCDQRVSVQLTPVAGGESITTGLAPTAAQAGQASFEFPLLVPGKYIIKMEKPEWCWQKDQFEVELTDSIVDSIEFVQSGYNLRVQSSHDVTLQYQLPTTSTHASKSQQPQAMTVKHDSIQVVCLATPGVYHFKPVSDSFQFEHDSYTYSTDEPHGLSASLKITAQRVKVTGEISVSESQHMTTATYTITPINAQPLSEQTLTLVPKKGAEHEVLQYSIWANQGDLVHVQAASKLLMFYPTHANVKVSKLATGISLPQIQGRPGLFIKGHVKPAVSGVIINVFDESDDSLAFGDMTTDKYGEYSIGPLFDTHTYRVEASAAGFHLAPETTATGVTRSSGNINFKTAKLGSLRVKVVSSSDDGTVKMNEPIVGALLSMSGAGGGYRANNATNENGEVLFANIFPGEYYLMPLLKEYTFAKDKRPAQVPQHQSPLAISVKEGSDHLVLVGSRIAFSCYGRVSSLNAQPEKGVYIEARSGQLLEKAQTDQQGNYRLRGLVPGQTYTIQLSSDASQIERTSPAQYAIESGKQDILDRDFLAFRKTSSRFEVFGHIVTNATLLQYITVQLWEQADSNDKAPPSEHPVKELKLFNDADFFSFSGLSRSKYALKLKLDSSLNKGSININSDLATAHVTFSPDTPSRFVNISLASETVNEVVEVPAGQLYATIIALCAAAGFYYRKSITKYIKNKQMKESDQPTKKSKRVPVEDQFVANLNKRFGKSPSSPSSS